MPSTQSRRWLLRRLGAAAAAGAIAGCSAPAGNADPGGSPAGSSPTQRPPSPAEPPTAETPETSSPAFPEFAAGPIEYLSYANARFGLALAAHLAGRTPGRNLLLSPYSLSAALAMTYAGARGETRTGMRETLGFPEPGGDGPPDERLHGAFRSLRESLFASGPPVTPTPTPAPTPSPTPTPTPTERMQTFHLERRIPFRLRGANALWGQAGFPYQESYIDALDTYYGAGLRTVDFRGDPGQARDRINGWVEEETHGEIPDLFPRASLRRNTRLVLTNALYFQATWEKPFAPGRTEGAAFTALDGSETAVPMMEKTDTFPYAAGGGHQMIELPYEGGDVGMVVILPAEGEFGEFWRSLTVRRLREFIDAMEPERGKIALPKFGYRSRFGLKRVLSDLGMSVAFDPRRADFTGMIREEEVDGRLVLDDVRHECTITVNETGTVAAAASGVEVVLVSAPAFEMRVDRPFLFLIRHRPTNEPLFLGRVVDPANGSAG